ncbi:gluconokinase [Consotaella salsifontis]|uniref:Gluconokinase n=1 Tax=Consotaella salsifontis TaxID=1365950 RepID=A0A1T4MP13_9HYPH|nr:gluconokinase [Consotaella salsifontis]SJZ68556.1 gluconokinase [Consotaella salsifontis]
MGGRAKAIVVMGPSGVGKTTTAMVLAARLGWPYAEGDDFHPLENIAKMSAGIPLQDADREPWLAAIRDWIDEQARGGASVVVTCSALKRRYRDILRQADVDLCFLFLAADQLLVGERVARRAGHYMPPSLLASQFGDLEPLQADEPGIFVTVDKAPEAVAEEALLRLAERGWAVKPV